MKKEFELLYYLYKNPNKTFTRNDLLDALWHMESPVDRTVDDHIYRVRKKIHALHYPVHINTIKGLGYQLVLEDTSAFISPLLDDKEFQQLTTRLIEKYQQYGQGEAIKLLSQQKAFGVEHTSTHFTYSIVKGDFYNLLKSANLHPSENVLILLFLHVWINGKNQASFHFYRVASKKQFFSNDIDNEAALLTPIFFAIYAKDYTTAQQRVEIAKDIIDSPSHGLYAFLQLISIIIAICQNNKNTAKALIHNMDKFLTERSYSREVGFLRILEGIFQLKYIDKNKGRELIRSGILISRQTQFSLNILLAVDMCLFLLNEEVLDPASVSFVNKEWKLLCNEYKLPKLKHHVEEHLRNALKS
ncbi:winged helix-turn-helix transcriptional regulator [Paenalkalicoccus suaedae]|uniref:Winged helix-turn-helix transcriptional regulator n=1 Tax=Paenalkalicoccus suaedae TaxID=2592382 RepID=A0A859FJQ7_9BACI|nr:winged helix-turn-helix domain-containing protein [Paenalkalicoccus suaedae]QKS73035.1 winged helix-turn-helix transcriptional regulator [Paenalkalicoccus suaedae]